MTDDRQKMETWLSEAAFEIQRLRHRCSDPEVTDLMLYGELVELRASMPNSAANPNAPLPAFLSLAPGNVDEAGLKCQVLRARLEMDEAESSIPLDIRRVLGLLGDLVAHLVELDQSLKSVAPAWRSTTRTAGMQDRNVETTPASVTLVEQLREFLVSTGRGRLQSALRAQRRAAQLCFALLGAVRGASAEVAREISLDFDSQKIIDEARTRTRSRGRAPTAEDYWEGFVEKGNFLTASEVERRLLKQIVTAVDQLVDQS